jgi:hypothetical protein
MAMNLRLSPKQTEELRKSAAQDGISMQEAALAGIVCVYISSKSALKRCD